MKTVFVVNNIVVGYGMTTVKEASVSSNAAGVTAYEVSSSTPVEINWVCTVNNNVPSFAPPAVMLQAVSPIEFKLLFTAPERVAIKNSVDPVVQDFFSIIDDPRLTKVELGLQSTQDALQYLVSKNLITAARRSEVMAGIPK